MRTLIATLATILLALAAFDSYASCNRNAKVHQERLQNIMATLDMGVNPSREEKDFVLCMMPEKEDREAFKERLAGKRPHTDLSGSLIIAAKQDMAILEQALKLYKLDNQRYPTTEQGLRALVTKPTSGPAANHWPSGGYLERLPKDPWSGEYRYVTPSKHNKDFDISVDKHENINNWSN